MTHEPARLAFGTADLGNLHRAVDEHEARAALEAAWDCGVRLFDTSPFYGNGLAELRLGAFLRSLPSGATPIVSTKVGRWLRPDADRRVASPFAAPLPFEPVFDYSHAGTLRSVEQSAQRLGIARFDLLLIHDLDRRNHGERYEAKRREAEGCVRALDMLRSAGDVRAIGIAANEADTGLDLLSLGDFDALLVAGRYTLLEQAALPALLPAAARRGLQVMLGGVFNSGILATGAVVGARHDYATAPAALRARAAAIEAITQRHGVSLAAAALQFAAAHPAVHSVLVGSSRADRVREHARALTQPLPFALWADLRTAGLIPTDAPVPQP